jgi:hypothetical protein
MPEDAKTQNLLEDFEVDEVSLVTKGANRKKFPIIKREEALMPEMNIEAILKGVEANKEKASKYVSSFIKKQSLEMDEGALTGLQSAMALLESVRSALPQGMRINICDDSDKYEGIQISVRKMSDGVIPDEEEVDESGKPVKGKKMPSKKSEEIGSLDADNLVAVIQKSECLKGNQKDAIASIIKGEGAMPEGKSEAEAIIKAENETLKGENTALKSRVEKLEEESMKSRIEKDANSFPSLDREKAIEALTKAAKVGDEQYDLVIKSLTTTEEIVAQGAGNILKESGKSEESIAKSEAALESKIEDIRKSDSTLTYEQAYTKALAENPKLYKA